VARRIQKLYGKRAEVIYPPVDTDFFQPGQKKEDFYVAASRVIPYKKMDLIVEAFHAMPEKRLIVIGDGPDFRKLKKRDNIEILGYQSKEVLRGYLQRAKGFVFAALEDFGILPVEAQACGIPVIAYGKGGSLETVVDGVTGLFFKEQTVSSIVDAIERFEKQVFDPEVIRTHELRFSKQRFKDQFQTWVETEWTKRFALSF
jgi:glycosyltransferase involved in cell wall biosynthesis